MKYSECFSKFSGYLLTEYVPEKIVNDKNAVIDFIDNHRTSMHRTVSSTDLYYIISNAATYSTKCYIKGLGAKSVEFYDMSKVAFSI